MGSGILKIDYICINCCRITPNSIGDGKQKAASILWNLNTFAIGPTWLLLFLLFFNQCEGLFFSDLVPCDVLFIYFPQAAAYYYHGLILDEGNTEKSHGMAVAAFQAADEYLKESKKASEAFNTVPPLSR